MRLLFSFLALLAVSSMAAGCTVQSDGEDPDADAEREEVATAQSPQVVIGDKRYLIQQSGVTVASAWAGTIGSGATVEYWAAKPTYVDTAARSLDGDHSTCANWKASVCNKTWAGATYYRADFSQRTLDCALPPGPCTGPKGTTPFLGAGSYFTTDPSGGALAWTYVAGECEYWAMHSPISMGVHVQTPLSPGFASHSAFISEMCAKSPVPSTYYEATYIELACSAIVC